MIQLESRVDCGYTNLEQLDRIQESPSRKCVPTLPPYAHARRLSVKYLPVFGMDCEATACYFYQLSRSVGLWFP